MSWADERTELVGSPGFEKNELARRWQACMHGLTK
jgi:hypothetical protein